MRSALIRALRRLVERLVTDPIRDEMDTVKVLAGRSLVREVRSLGPGSIQRAEFRVFSQFGEDGIIQYLLHTADVRENTFVEFGVEDYREANTRFLLLNDNWRGLVLDASADRIGSIRKQDIYWRHTLEANAAFITRDNIDGLIAAGGMQGDIGLLSIDIDGNDYWVWDAIRSVSPEIVVVEYNALFGPDAAVTIPYDPLFSRERAHFSRLYFGASLRALALLGERKGFALVGCNSAGNNAFFVRKDRLGSLARLEPREAYMAAKFREVRDAEGRLNSTSIGGRVALIRDLPLHDVESDRRISVGEALGP